MSNYYVSKESNSHTKDRFPFKFKDLGSARVWEFVDCKVYRHTLPLPCGYDDAAPEMTKTLAYRSLLVLIGCVIPGCAGHIWWPGALADFRVTSRGYDSGGEYCSDFTLTPAQARWFFGRAERLGATPKYDHLDQFPCWVRGTARGMDGVWRWEIRDGGSARLIQPDGAEQILRCSNCRAILPERQAPKLP